MSPADQKSHRQAIVCREFTGGSCKKKDHAPVDDRKMILVLHFKKQWTVFPCSEFAMVSLERNEKYDCWLAPSVERF